MPTSPGSRDVSPSRRDARGHVDNFARQGPIRDLDRYTRQLAEANQNKPEGSGQQGAGTVWPENERTARIEWPENERTARIDPVNQPSVDHHQPEKSNAGQVPKERERRVSFSTTETSPVTSSHQDAPILPITQETEEPSTAESRDRGHQRSHSEGDIHTSSSEREVTKKPSFSQQLRRLRRRGSGDSSRSGDQTPTSPTSPTEGPLITRNEELPTTGSQSRSHQRSHSEEDIHASSSEREVTKKPSFSQRLRRLGRRGSRDSSRSGDQTPTSPTSPTEGPLIERDEGLPTYDHRERVSPKETFSRLDKQYNTAKKYFSKNPEKAISMGYTSYNDLKKEYKRLGDHFQLNLSLAINAGLSSSSEITEDLVEFQQITLDLTQMMNDAIAGKTRTRSPGQHEVLQPEELERDVLGIRLMRERAQQTQQHQERQTRGRDQQDREYRDEVEGENRRT